MAAAKKVERDKNDAPLSKIGVRGIVAHSGDSEGGEYAFFPDNEEKSWRAFPIKLNDFATQRRFELTDLDALVKSAAPVAVLSSDNKGKTFLVNLDALGDLEQDEKKSSPKAEEVDITADADAFMVRENQEYYAIPRKEFESLKTIDAGEAKRSPGKLFVSTPSFASDVLSCFSTA